METGNEIFNKTFYKIYKIKENGNWDIVYKYNLS
jgi:hypothetical protein